jgi:hypothetical protein
MFFVKKLHREILLEPHHLGKTVISSLRLNLLEPIGY